MTKVQAAARASLTVLAQGLSSVTNFAAGALALDAADGDLGAFGRFAIAFQVCQVVIAIGHASSGTTVLIHGAKKDDAEGSVDALRAGAATAAIVIGLGLGTVIGGIGLILGAGAGATLLIAAGAPALTSQYALRASYFATDNAAGVVRADAIWFAVLLAAAAGDATGAWDPAPYDYLAVWLIGAAISALPSLITGLGRGRRYLGLFWTTTGQQAIRTGFDSLLARSVFVFTLFAAERIVGDESSGAIAAAVLVFSPLTVVHTSSAAVVLPTTIRKGGIHKPTVRLPILVSAAIGVITLGWAAVLLGFNETTLAFGPFDLDASGVTGWLFLATLVRFLAMAFWRGPEIALRVADAATETLQARMVGTCVQWILPVIGFAIADTNGGAFGLAFGTWVGGVVAWERYRRFAPPIID